MNPIFNQYNSLKANLNIRKFGALKRKSSEEYVQMLIDKGEHQQLDFKFEISDSRKIARTLAAFANTDGGKLLVGVKDNGSIAGVRSEEEYYMVEAAAQMYCKPEITFSTTEFNLQGKMVLEIEVKKSLQKHKAPDKNNQMRYYIRVKDQNLLAHPVFLRVWELENRTVTQFKLSEKERNVFQFLQSGKLIDYESVYSTLQIPKRLLNNILAHLVYYQVIRIELAEKHTLFQCIDINKDLETVFQKKQLHNDRKH